MLITTEPSLQPHLIGVLVYYYSSVVQLEIRGGDTSGDSFTVQDCFSYPESFAFPCEIEYCSFNVCKELCWDFDEDCIESVNYC